MTEYFTSPEMTQGDLLRIISGLYETVQPVKKGHICEFYHQNKDSKDWQGIAQQILQRWGS